MRLCVLNLPGWVGKGCESVSFDADLDPTV